jgi:hypothetical protein
MARRLRVGEEIPPLPYPDGSARHLISVIEIAAKEHTPLDSDLI